MLYLPRCSCTLCGLGGRIYFIFVDYGFCGFRGIEDSRLKETAIYTDIDRTGEELDLLPC